MMGSYFWVAHLAIFRLRIFEKSVLFKVLG